MKALHPCEKLVPASVTQIYLQVTQRAQPRFNKIKYIAIGYAVIALLIGGIVFIYLHEWRELERIEAESKEMNMLRQKVHDAYAQMLDLTLYGEKVLEWNAEDTLVYRDKRLAMDSILCEFKQYYRPERLLSLRICNAEVMSRGL